MLYRIAWQSQVTGISGHGEYRLTLEEADAWVNEGNQKYPWLRHWKEQEDSGPMPPPKPSADSRRKGT